MERGIEMIALNVGKGDATLIRTGNYTCLIDTGRYSARKQLLEDLEYLNVQKLDDVFITHIHNDHAGGLRKLRKSGMPIGAIYASKYHPECKRKEHPAEKNAGKLGMEVQWLSAGDVVSAGGSQVTIRVLAPASQIGSSENDNSLVLLFKSADGRILLTGDMESKEEAELLKSAVSVACDVLKVPKHGDDDACSDKFLKACGAKVAVISTNTDEKPKTPARRILNFLNKHGCECYVTQESSIGIRIRLDNGHITAERIIEKKESEKNGN